MKPNFTLLLLLLILLCSFFLLFKLSISGNTIVNSINKTYSLKDGDLLTSQDSTFQLGFFSASESTTTPRYLGVWYTQSPDVVPWVANKQVPINTSSGFLRIATEGVLHLVGDNNISVWSSNVSGQVGSNPIAQLLDSGNLVVRNENDENPDNYLWQSFDYPGDSLVTGMKLGVNRITGQNRFLSSWNSSEDPSKGEFTFGFDVSTLPQLVVKSGSKVRWRSGPWNGYLFTGMPEVRSNLLFNFTYFSNDKEVYLKANPTSSKIARLVLTTEGNLRWYMWTGTWTENIGGQTDACDYYGTCGTFGLCENDNSPLCSCVNGFVPRDQQQWDLGNGTTGCIRKTQLNCYNDGFEKLAKVKVPDTLKYWSNSSINLEQCRQLCLKNCSCTAYTNLDVTGRGSGCLQWFVDLIDIRSFPESGQDIFVRLARSDIEATDNRNTNTKLWIIVGVSLSVAVLIIGVVVFVWRNKCIKNGFLKSIPKDGSNEDIELPLFDLATLSCATNGFADENKLGEGGFGPVYKGVFKDGKDIAVKRLSTESKQGLSEFKNEVSHIAKLQHRNLVKLLGCCVEANENMLIYEYMHNKSLDLFLFDPTRSMSLSWPQRHHIINGIA